MTFYFFRSKHSHFSFSPLFPNKRKGFSSSATSNEWILIRRFWCCQHNCTRDRNSCVHQHKFTLFLCHSIFSSFVSVFLSVRLFLSRKYELTHAHTQTAKLTEMSRGKHKLLYVSDFSLAFFSLRFKTIMYYIFRLSISHPQVKRKEYLI